MIICIDARIPLILVGKPGSSKSLAMQVPCDTCFVSKRRAFSISPKYAARLKQWLFWLMQLQLFHRLQELPGWGFGGDTVCLQIIRDRFHRETKPANLNYFPDIAVP